MSRRIIHDRRRVSGPYGSSMVFAVEIAVRGF